MGKLSVPMQPHAIVLGLGVAGSSIAATLAQRGFRVTGVEQFSPLHERGSSHGDTRIFRRVPHEGDVYVRMAAASYEGWHLWNRMAGEALFMECGGIDAGPEGSPMVMAAQQLCEKHGEGFEVLDGRGLNRRHVHSNLPLDWMVVYQPSSGVVRPDATRTFLHQLAREHGAKLLHETAVHGIEASANQVTVRTAHATLSADFLVVAAGSWLPKLLPELELRLSTERRVLAWFDVAEGVTLSGGMPIFCLDADGGWYGMPTPDGRMKIGHDKHLRQWIDPDMQPIAPDARDAELLSACMRKYFVGFSGEPSEMKPCIYTLTDDHHFLMDWHPTHAKVLVFSCCSGHGFKYAPVYGEIAADMLKGKPRVEAESFGLGRRGSAVVRFS